ncbi:hypothetical protein Esti_005901 [Eimeria stiedai]
MPAPQSDGRTQPAFTCAHEASATEPSEDLGGGASNTLAGIPGEDSNAGNGRSSTGGSKQGEDAQGEDCQSFPEAAPGIKLPSRRRRRRNRKSKSTTFRLTESLRRARGGLPRSSDGINYSAARPQQFGAHYENANTVTLTSGPTAYRQGYRIVIHSALQVPSTPCHNNNCWKESAKQWSLAAGAADIERNGNVAAGNLSSTSLSSINAESVDSLRDEGGKRSPPHALSLANQQRSCREKSTVTSVRAMLNAQALTSPLSSPIRIEELNIGKKTDMVSLDRYINTHAYSATNGTSSQQALIDAQLSSDGANSPPPPPNLMTPDSAASELGSDRFVPGEGFDMLTQDIITSEECVDLFNDFYARSPSQHDDEEEFLPMNGLEGFRLPESMVAPDNYMGLALLRVAGREIRKELGLCRSLMSSPAQLRQECIDSLCTPTERFLTEAEAGLRRACRSGGLSVLHLHTHTRPTELHPQQGTPLWLLSSEGSNHCMELVEGSSWHWNLTRSEISYVNHRLYEFVADYHFAMTMHEFLFGSWPLEPRKEMPGQAALASRYVLRILSGRNRCPRGDVTKRSLVQFHLEHIAFRRQLQVDKRILLSDLLMPRTFISSHASRLSSRPAHHREP